MHDSYAILHLEAGAGILEVDEAYKRLKELYSQGSLAIYSLVTELERKDRLEQIESAYHSILDSLRHQHGHNPAVGKEVGQPDSIPDPELSTGAYLRWAREQAGLSIRQLADRTKIGSCKLEDIEAERFGQLPPPVYLRGFVYEFARCLGLANAFELSEFYLKRITPGSDG